MAPLIHLQPWPSIKRIGVNCGPVKTHEEDPRSLFRGNHHFNIARIYHDTKEWDNALEWLAKALEINPHFADAMKFQALILKERAGNKTTPAVQKEMAAGTVAVQSQWTVGQIS